MMNTDCKNNNELFFDVLQELGNIGSSNAVTALTKMLGSRAKLHLPKINLLEFSRAAEMLGGPEDLVFGILVGISGDIKGIMMYLVKVSSARSLIKYLIGTSSEEGTEFTDMDISALEEMGNILSTSYLNALAMLTDMKIVPSVPNLAMDMAAAILSVPAIEFGKVADKVLFIESVFGTEDESLSSYFILVPDMDSIGKILTSLGVV